MKINRLELKINVPVTYEDVIDFKNASYDSYHVRNIKDCHVVAVATEYGEFLSVKINISCTVLTTSAYTLKNLDYEVKIKDELCFTDNKDLEDAYFYEKLPQIDLDDYIFSLIVTNVPTKVVGKNEKLPESGDGYRIMSEEDFYNEKKNKKSSPFDVLDNLDLDN